MRIYYLLFLVSIFIIIFSCIVININNSIAMNSFVMGIFFIGLSGLFFLFQNVIIAILEISIYSGSVIVLFLFVTIFLDLDKNKNNLFLIQLKTIKKFIMFIIFNIFLIIPLIYFYFFRKKFVNEMGKIILERGTCFLNNLDIFPFLYNLSSDNIKLIGLKIVFDYSQTLILISLLMISITIGVSAITSKFPKKIKIRK
jgi:NADH:ubiquinone oxidoreductase subunit 6 (subunit J)